MEKKDLKFVNNILNRIAQFGDGELEFETRDIERLCRLTQFFETKDNPSIQPRDPSTPRRNYVPDWCEAEKSIYNAMQEVEKMGADVRLTNAIIKLSEAKDFVSDYIDSI